MSTAQSWGLVVCGLACFMVEWMSVLTGRNLGTSCGQQVNSLLHIGNAGREVCAALKELNLLAEVVHGVGTEAEAG